MIEARRIKYDEEGEELEEERLVLLDAESGERIVSSIDNAGFLIEFLYKELEPDEMGPFKIIDPDEIEEVQAGAKSKGYEDGYEEGFSDGLSQGYKEGFSDGLTEVPDDIEEMIGFEAVKQLFVDGKVLCHRCLEERSVSLHHLVPRKHGGADNVENLIPLCDDCHDEVEILTEHLFEEKGSLDPSDLRTFVESGFPGE